MRPVAVIGIGKTPFGAFPGQDLRTLAAESAEKAMQNACIEPGRVEAFYFGNFAGPSFVGQSHLAPFVAGAMGITGIPCTRIEAACASSGSAFFHAAAAVGAGLYDLVLVTGAEKMTCQDTPRVAEILAMAGDCGSEGKAGATFPALFALIAHRHMYQYGTKREHLAAVAVKNHANGAKNPDAHMKKVITIEQALASKPIAAPLTVYDCSLVSDGAASVVLCPLDRVREFTDKPVQILGLAQTSDYVALDRKATSRVSLPFRAQRQRRTRWRDCVLPISRWPRYTTASLSPRSLPSRISDSRRKAGADSTPWKGERALTATCR